METKYLSALTDAAFLNYAFNFEIGGCDCPGEWSESDFPIAYSTTVRSPSLTVLLSDSGTRSLNTTDLNLCVTVQPPQKAGGFVLNDQEQPSRILWSLIPSIPIDVDLNFAAITAEVWQLTAMSKSKGIRMRLDENSVA